jgi:phage shock protein A
LTSHRQLLLKLKQTEEEMEQIRSITAAAPTAGTEDLLSRGLLSPNSRNHYFQSQLDRDESELAEYDRVITELESKLEEKSAEIEQLVQAQQEEQRLHAEQVANLSQVPLAAVSVSLSSSLALHSSLMTLKPRSNCIKGMSISWLESSKTCASNNKCL